MLRRISVSIITLGLVAVTLVGCSRYQKEQRAEWRSAAEKSCLKSGIVKETAHVKIARALEGSGTCGADHPVKVTAFTSEAPTVAANTSGIFGGLSRALSTKAPATLTKLNQEGTFTCPMYAAVNRWLEQVVQPVAMARFGQPVVELRTMGTYSCRRMNNGTGTARYSEHAFANAIDIGGFRLADGSIVTILKGWKGALEEQHFLREVHAGACSHFSTVLGPGVALHHDHLHMDMARHGRRGDRSICRPYPQPVPPPNEGFPIDPAKGALMSSATSVAPTGNSTFASIAPRPPVAFQSGLPAVPRNPIAEREEQAYRDAPPRSAYPAQANPNRVNPMPQDSRRPEAPIMLYGKGRGPFLPLKENEIDPEDLDPVTGSVGE
jgi:hypothetical protein